jgi:transglutaminase-like putative cysteine protease
MRIQIHHETVYRYAVPAKYVIQKLRLTPRSHDGQHVRRWRIEVSGDCRLTERDDAFGNLVQTFTVTGSLDELAVRIDGEVETEDTSGVITGTAERLPLALFLRETELTAPDEAIRLFAAQFADRTGDDRLSMLHDLVNALRARIRFDAGRTDAGTTARDSFRLGHGVCQDFSHIFISVCRHLGIPARYIGGYLVQMNGGVAQDAGHAWAEAWVEDLGWVGFDPANGVCVNDAYIRVANGLDYLGAAPVRGAQTGGRDESLDVTVRVQDLAAQQ